MERKLAVWGLFFSVSGIGLSVTGYLNEYLGYACAAIAAGLLIWVLTLHLRKPKGEGVGAPMLKVGQESVVVGNIQGTVGDKSTIVGATDNKGNTILNKGPLAIGHGAKAGPGSISIGTNAGAGLEKKKD